MKRRLPNYHNLWKRPKLVYAGHEQAYFKKAMDALCMKADLQEQTLDYVKELCQGMHQLSEIGLQAMHFQHHPILLQKILCMGRDLMDHYQKQSDEFYLGIFLELKLVSQWKQKGFFSLLVKMIDRIRLKAQVFSQRVKNRLLSMLKKHNPALYQFYFCPLAA